MSEARDVGPLAEEAAKLLGALAGLAGEHADEAGDGLFDLADRAASTVRGIDAHLATGAADCTVCPLCRTIHAVRQINPEVTTHLTSAFSSLVQAATVLLGTPAPPRAADAAEKARGEDGRPEESDGR